MDSKVSCGCLKLTERSEGDCDRLVLPGDGNNRRPRLNDTTFPILGLLRRTILTPINLLESPSFSPLRHFHQAVDHLSTMNAKISRLARLRFARGAFDNKATLITQSSQTASCPSADWFRARPDNNSSPSGTHVESCGGVREVEDDIYRFIYGAALEIWRWMLIIIGPQGKWNQA
jgi:hypothetical protein